MTSILPSHSDAPTSSCVGLWVIRLMLAVYVLSIVKSVIDGLTGAVSQSPLTLALTFIQAGIVAKFFSDPDEAMAWLEKQ